MPDIEDGDTNVGVWRWVNFFLKVFYVLLFPFRLFSLSVFVVFDHVCLAHERASILDCTQEIFVSHPEKWVLVWLGSSIVSSIFVISLIRLNRKQLNCDLVFKAMWELAPLWKKGSFWSLNFLCLITCLHYFIQIAINRFTCLSLFLIFWLIATLSFVYCLNYLPLVWKLPPGDTRNSKDVKKHRITFICLIITLIIYLIENAFMTLAMMLDAALEVVPKIQKKYKGQFSDGVILLLLAFRVLFITRLLSFFWSKVFHRNKDFFSDQNPRLVDDEMQPILKSGNNNEMPPIQSDNNNEMQPIKSDNGTRHSQKPEVPRRTVLSQHGKNRPAQGETSM